MRQYVLEPRPGGTRRSGFLSELNDEQRRVAEAGAGPLLVIAGAGTGKTRTLVYRTAHLIDQGVDADRLLLLTFTNKAAKEMVDRVAKLVPLAAEKMWAGTFHHIGNRILRRHADRIGYGSNFGIVNSEEAHDLMAATLGEVVGGPEGKRFPKADVVLSMLSAAVNTDRPLARIVGERFPQFLSHLPLLDKVVTRYLEHKVAMNLMDYDDLLVNWRLLLEDHADIRELYAERFLHVLVDEYQDTNKLQAALVRQMSSRHGNVMVVGDDCQAIYSFRGADVSNILDFPKLYPGAAVYRLEVNYRSTPQILAIANRSIRFNRRQFEKTLEASREDGERPACISLADGEQQARFVAQRVLELRDEGVELGNMAILYRAHYQAMELQLELQRRGIPFKVRSGMRFFEQAHIRDLLAHLRVVFNPLDRLAWTRVLRLQEGIGNAHANSIFGALTRDGDPWRALQSGIEPSGLSSRARKGYHALRETLLAIGAPGLTGNPAAMFDLLLDRGYERHLRESYENGEQRVEDVRQLGHFAAQYDDYRAFLEELALVENVSAEQIQRGGDPDEVLLLSTVHQSKGLEWDVVFVLHLSDGRFPLGRALRSQDEEEEERRLFYVAVTRARRELYLCHTQWAVDRDRVRVLQRPSRFLAELPMTDGQLLETWRIAEGP
jgi:DNA helicase-2/ATP-dependent DNA helicase PcrA